MKLDSKSVIIGLLLGVIIMFVSGAGGGGGYGGQIGFSVPAGSTPIVRGTHGHAFVVDMNTLMAKRILFKEPVPADPRFPNIVNGRALILGN